MLPDGSFPPFDIIINGTSVYIHTDNSSLVGEYQVLFKNCFQEQIGIYILKINIKLNTPPYLNF